MTVSRLAAVPSEKPFLKVLGAGSNGIGELQDLLDDEAVQWAVIRFDIGSGSFCRRKFLFLHLNGERCPVVRRGQANAHTADAQQLLRAGNQEGFHASLMVTQKEEVTEEQLLSRVGHFFVKDDLEYSKEMATLDIKRQVDKSVWEVASPSRAVGLDARGRPSIPGHQSFIPFASGRDALQAIAANRGPWNWVLVKPNPDTMELVTGGPGSVDEMRECLLLHREVVLFGLLRLVFGAGRLKRTKHVLVHAVGDLVPIVTRGRMAAERSKMEFGVRGFAHCPVTFEVSNAQEFTIEAVIERVRRSATIDDAVLDGDSASRCTYSVEAFRDAQRDERLMAPAQPFPEKVAGPCTRWADQPAADVVRLLHAPDGPLNWALFGLSGRTVNWRHSAPARCARDGSATN